MSTPITIKVGVLSRDHYDGSGSVTVFSSYAEAYDEWMEDNGWETKEDILADNQLCHRENGLVSTEDLHLIVSDVDGSIKLASPVSFDWGDG